jgi:hypothetical protein
MVLEAREFSRGMSGGGSRGTDANLAVPFCHKLERFFVPIGTENRIGMDLLIGGRRRGR